jgi:hypothetical protein
MSHFTVVRTQLRDEPALLKALADLGFPHVECHETPQPLYGFEGDMREDVAEVIVRRQYVGSASNDLGFKRAADGSYTAVISEYDREAKNDAWLGKLSQRYALHMAVETLSKQGYKLHQEQQQGNGTLKVVLRRYA